MPDVCHVPPPPGHRAFLSGPGLVECAWRRRAVGVVRDGPRGSGAASGRDRAELPVALGVPLSDDILERALTHRSYAYENGGLPTNERLEFLGDAVLGLTVTDELFHRHPERSEGDLAKLRASVVNTQALAEVARNLTDQGLDVYLLLGRGEINTGGADKSSILADSMESLLGAIYVHHG